MFCKNCGKELELGAIFCPVCGMSADSAPTEKRQGQPDYPQQPQQYGQPGYPQPQQYYAPQPKAKSKKPLFLGVGAAVVAALALVFVLVIMPAIRGGSSPRISDDDVNLDIEIFATPGTRDVPFDPIDGGFTAYDANIGMIEINQGLSYGFNSETGEYYLMDNFVAGKETGIFVTLEKEPDPESEITLTIEKDGQEIAKLFPELITEDTKLLLFQPRDMAEVNYWQAGAYTFTFTIDDKQAERTTNFFDSMPVKVLAVPIIANYSGRVFSCEGEWMNSSSVLMATYPVAKGEFEYVLGPELDLSDPKYDINTDEGQYRVWRALRNLQTPDEAYTLIVGFVRKSIGSAFSSSCSGYTYGMPANIVVEESAGMLRTVAHEIAHCYKIGDEYPDGSLNDILNPPPYGMEGHDILTLEPAVGTKEKVVGGFAFDLDESGSMVYPDQRAYWVEERMLISQSNITSFMGWDTGASYLDFWITSDIWNHLFKAFTGQLNGNEPGYGSAPDQRRGEYWGQCFRCYRDMYNPKFYIQCHSCFSYTSTQGEVFDCDECGAGINLRGDYLGAAMYIECPTCRELLFYPNLMSFNRGSGGAVYDDEVEYVPIIEIAGYFEPGGTFVPHPWYSYPTPLGTVTTNKSGEYSVRVYDADGKVIAITYFDVIDKSQQTSLSGAPTIPNAVIPVEVIARFPENAGKIVIMRGDREVYAKNVSNSAPTVAFTGLSEGQQLSDNMTLTWEASDADGDELFFQIWYYLNTDEYYLLDSDLTGTSYNVDMSAYPGSSEGFFCILATDGVRTTEKNSPLVKTPFKPPAILTEQKSIPKVYITEEIYFPTEIFDAQDGRLSGNNVRWTLNGEEVSTTSVLQTEHSQLEPGVYTYICIATNSAGLSAQKEFTFEITDVDFRLPAIGRVRR